MFNYIIRRTLYSALVIFGVMVITFLLFRVAAGDPALTVLGKNPSPNEIESMRRELGSDKPLFWGKWRKTEVFSGVVFDRERKMPGFKIEGDFSYKDNSLVLEKGRLVFTRNYDVPEKEILLNLDCKGKFETNGTQHAKDSRTTENFTIPSEQKEIILSTLPGSQAVFYSAEFFRPQVSPWNTQLFESVTEVISFSETFPYIRFFNFGRTLITREPIRKVLFRGIWPSLALMLPIFFGELIIGIILALFATAFKGDWTDKGIVLLSVAGMSVSYLVFIIFGQWYLAYYFNLFPVWGWGDIRHLALPVIIGILSGLGGGVRFYRTIFVNELNREYLRTALAKGCNPFTIYSKHLLKNAMIPIITRATTVLPFLFTGSLLLETFFGIPGLGYAGINALNNSDLQMIKALVIVGAFIFVFVNLIADIAYAWADPRIRLK